MMADVASLTGTDGKQGFDTTAASQKLDSVLILTHGCKSVDFVVYEADLLNLGKAQKWAIGMYSFRNAACLIRVDVVHTPVIELTNVGQTIATNTGYGGAWLYGSNIYASTNEASSADLQNVVQFKNITVNSDHTSGTVSFVVVSKSAVTNENDGLNCPVSASPFNTNCPCGDCNTCYTAPPTTTAVATQLEFTVDADGCVEGIPCSTQPVVAIQDYLAQTITTSTVTVCLSVREGPGFVNGTTCVAAVGGIATFTDISFSALGSYVLSAAATSQEGAALSAVSSCVTVTRGSSDSPGSPTTSSPTTAAPTSAPPTAPPTGAWDVSYTYGEGLPYDASNDQLPAYVKAADSAAECVERCTTNRQKDTARGLPGCVAASWRSATGSQRHWCVQWEAACTDAAPDHVSTYVSEAGTTIILPSKIVEPSTLPADDTVWATREAGWETWMLDGEWAWLHLALCMGGMRLL